jgi:hypothetical protein
MKILLFITIGAIALVSCGNGGGGDPAETVERYMEAKVAGDAEAIRGLLCSEMEVHLERESRTFDSVSGVELQGMACQQDGQSTTVRCQGKILALYGAEQTEFPLVSYRVVQEDGEWKWCGEAP